MRFCSQTVPVPDTTWVVSPLQPSRELIGWIGPCGVRVPSAPIVTGVTRATRVPVLLMPEKLPSAFRPFGLPLLPAMLSRLPVL